MFYRVTVKHDTLYADCVQISKDEDTDLKFQTELFLAMFSRTLNANVSVISATVWIDCAHHERVVYITETGVEARLTMYDVEMSN